MENSKDCIDKFQRIKEVVHSVIIDALLCNKNEKDKTKYNLFNVYDRYQYESIIVKSIINRVVL